MTLTAAEDDEVRFELAGDADDFGFHIAGFHPARAGRHAELRTECRQARGLGTASPTLCIRR